MIDWRAVLEDLRLAGCSTYRAAKLIARPASTVQSWAEGHEPAYSGGLALLELHARLCGKDKTKFRATDNSVYTGSR